MINQFGDSIITYTVEMGRVNDAWPKLCIKIDAKCDYMAAAIAERLRPGYIAFHVYKCH